VVVSGAAEHIIPEEAGELPVYPGGDLMIYNSSHEGDRGKMVLRAKKSDIDEAVKKKEDPGAFKARVKVSIF
jgi:hypothetical protein